MECNNNELALYMHANEIKLIEVMLQETLKTRIFVPPIYIAALQGERERKRKSTGYREITGELR